MNAGRMLLALSLLALAGCGPGLDTELVAAGRELFLAEGCPACHGRQGEGGKMGPDLRKVRRHWNLEGLAAYLADPASQRQRDGRLQRLNHLYAAHMPTFAGLPQERRVALAAFLLSR